MSRLTPCKRREFHPPFAEAWFRRTLLGTRHQFMVYQQQRLAIPSNSEYSVPQLKMMLAEMGSILGRSITLQEWNEL